MKSIVIISTSADFLETCTAYLRQRDFAVKPFAHIHEYLSHTQSQHETAHAVLLDEENLKTEQTLPIAIENLFHGVPTLILGTDYALPLQVLNNAPPHFSTRGAVVRLEKPIQLPHLHSHLEHLLAGTRIQNPVLLPARQNEPSEIIAQSDAFKKIVERAQTAAPTQANIILFGESGTGKEVLARMIHANSSRAQYPLLSINCSALPEAQLELALFGYAKEAVADAFHGKAGLLEEAHQSTLFLDEVDELSLNLQTQLLRVVQDKKIKRVGENFQREADVRIISATQKDLRREIAQGSFREDLFFRLNVIPINIPALRNRREDILPLAEHFLHIYRNINNKISVEFSPEAKSYLLARHWLGNVRELQSSVERAVVLTQGTTISAEILNDIDIKKMNPEITDFPVLVQRLTQEHPLTIDRLIKIYIKHVLQKNKGAKEKTARELDIDRKTLYRKLQEMLTENII